MNKKDIISKVKFRLLEKYTAKNLLPSEEIINDCIDNTLKAINYTRCCETLKDEGQATLTEYATELINMQENPQDSNKDWKIVVIQNTIGKLYETLQNL